MTPKQFQTEFNVPRGTMTKFEKYAELLTDWQQRMNLVGPSTLSDIWGRHFADSAQLGRLNNSMELLWLDIGSGAGFPGIVVALLGHINVHLVESTSKKCRFLEVVVDELGLGNQVRIHNCRIESMSRFHVGVISARACASLSQLFEWGLPMANKTTRWLLPKGEMVQAEMTTARQGFLFDSELVPSLTDARGRIIVASKVRRNTQ